jgi:hypothetical protein
MMNDRTDGASVESRLIGTCSEGAFRLQRKLAKSQLRAAFSKCGEANPQLYNPARRV